MVEPSTGGIAADPVKLAGVHKHYGEVQAVNGIDLTIETGQVVAFLGPNGAGKTTTLDMILSLSEPTSGSVTVFGTTPRAAVDAGQVAAVTQTGGLVADMTAYQHVRVMADLFGYPASRAREVIEETGLADLAKRQAKVCSGGERQRIKFAMSLVSNPELLIFDEPTTGMDVNARRSFWEGVHAQAAKGRTIIFATHYLEEADEYADRIVMVVGGKIVADGTVAEIRNRVSGRTCTCNFPDQAALDAATNMVRDLADKVDVQGLQLSVHTKQSDEVLKRLIGQDTGATDILVTSQGIEDVFIALAGGQDK